MDIHQNEIVTFRMNEYLMSLEPNQDQEIIRTYERKTGRIKKVIKEKQTDAKYYDVKFGDGFLLKSVSSSHLTPIRAKKYKGRN